jgi:hypothetical protein
MPIEWHLQGVESRYVSLFKPPIRYPPVTKRDLRHILEQFTLSPTHVHRSAQDNAGHNEPSRFLVGGFDFF